MKNKRETFKNMLKIYNDMFNEKYKKENDSRLSYIINNNISKYKIKTLCKQLNINEISSDYFWFLNTYGYLDFFGRDILGYVNDTYNFMTETIIAKNIDEKKRKLKYGDCPYVLKNNFIILNHEEGDGEVDLIMDILSGKVYWWEYWYNNYYEYTPSQLNMCNDFLDFLIDALLSSVESDEFDVDLFLINNHFK